MKLIKKIVTLDFLHGYKTYGGSFILAIIGVAVAFHYITQDQATALGAVVGAFTVASIRKSIN